MKTSLAAVLMLAGCCGLNTAPLSRPLVKITSHPDPGGSASAVPLWNSEGYAWYVTCAHCLPVAAVDGQVVMFSWKHPTLDLALLKVRGDVVVGSVLAQESPKFGDRLTALGHGLGKFLQLTDGRAGYTPGDMTCPIIYGCSGGAVLNAHNELVGIIRRFQVLTSPWGAPVTHISYYVPLRGLENWLRDPPGL